MKYILAIAVTSVLTACSLQASAGALSPSWVRDEPLLLSSQVIGQPVATVCQGTYELRRVSGDSSMHNICFSLESSKGIRLGLYFVNANPHYVVSMRNDPAVYPFGGCESYDNCLYMPSTDALVRREHLINGIVRSLVIYKNFSERLVRHPSLALSGQSFSFDNSHPDYVMQSSQGYPWPILGVGGSTSGDWLGVQLRERGFVVIDMKTFTVKRFANQDLRTGTEIALTNDGRSVAVMSDDFGQRVFEVSDDCGDDPGDWERPLSAERVCSSRYLYVREYGAVGQSAGHPRFDLSGDMLSFDVATEGGVMGRIQLSRTGELARIEYIALGDSFSSGEGEVEDGYYIAGTNEEFNKCHTSYRSYPFMLSFPTTKSVACSGARIDDVIATNAVYWGQGGRLGADQQSLTNSQRIEYQQTALETFLPGVTNQEKFIQRYRPLVATIGVGGNDAGLMGKLQTCLMPGTCEWARDSNLRQGTSDEIGRLFERLISLYTHLHSLSPDTKFYAVGYPKIIDPDGNCSITIASMLDYDERVFMDESITYLNQVIEAAAFSAGVQYINIEDALGLHRLCGSEESAINTIRFGEEIAPIKQASWLKVFGSESFHPTPLGHERISEKINEYILTNEYPECHGGKLCVREVSRPEPGSYWRPGLEVTDTLQVVSDFVHPKATFRSDYSIQAIFPDGTFQPGSPVRLELHSRPAVLGEFTADSNGGLDVMVDIPTTTEHGYHTVHALGTSATHMKLRIYQTVFVSLNEENIQESSPLTEAPQLSSEDTGTVHEHYTLTSRLADLASSGRKGEVLPSVLGAHQDTPELGVRLENDDDKMLYLAIAGAGLLGVIITVMVAIRVRYVRVNQ